MAADGEAQLPRAQSDERELSLAWLRYLRAAVRRNIEGLSEEQARWRPDGALISLLGIVNHLTHVEWRWIDGGMLGEAVSRSEAEFSPGPELGVADALRRYEDRQTATEMAVRSLRSLSA